jgi:hypothetical protein
MCHLEDYKVDWDTPLDSELQKAVDETVAEMNKAFRERLHGDRPVVRKGPCRKTRHPHEH